MEEFNFYQFNVSLNDNNDVRIAQEDFYSESGESVVLISLRQVDQLIEVLNLIKRNI